MIILYCIVVLWTSINSVFGRKKKKVTLHLCLYLASPYWLRFSRGYFSNCGRCLVPWFLGLSACLSSAQKQSCGFISSGDSWTIKLLLLEAPNQLFLSSQEKLQGCCSQGLLFLIPDSLFQDLHLWAWVFSLSQRITMLLVFSPLQHLRNLSAT